MDEQHPLDVWLTRNKRTRAWLAEKLDTTEASISRIINGQQWPGRDFFVALHKLTGLSPHDFLPARRKRASA